MALANAGWMIAGRLTADLLSLVTFSVVARESGAVGLGLYSSWFAIATLLHDLVSMGISDYGVREYSRMPLEGRPALLRRLFVLQLFACAVALAGVSIFVLSSSETIEQRLTLVFLATFQLANALAATLFVPGLTSGSVGKVVVATVLSRLGVAGTALVVSLFTENALLWILVGFPVFGMAFLGYALASFQGRLVSNAGLKAPGDGRALLLRLLPFAFATALVNILIRVPLVILMLAGDFAGAGLFAGALKLAEVGWMVISYVPTAAYAALVQHAQDDKQRFSQLAEQLLRVTVFLGALAAWGLSTVGPHLLVWILGPGLAGAAPLCDSLAIFLMAHVVGVTLLQVLLAAGRNSSRLGLLGMQLVLTTVVCLLLTSRQGVAGAAWGLALASILAIPAILLLLRAHLTRHSFARLLGSAAIVTLAVLTDAGLRELGALQASAAFASLIVLVGGMFAFGMINLRDFRDLTRHRMYTASAQA